MMDEDTETLVSIKGISHLSPEAQVVAVQQFTQAAISRTRWKHVSDAVSAICLAACFCTSCVVCYGGGL